ncbi:MAG: hypothetical protein QOE93_1606 [Actinomycetota bacterium]|nr:hypothetical protein [Actinomycetota bacterium]
MKVLHLVSSPRFAGVERYIALVAPVLAARGWDVTVAGGDPAGMQPLLDGSGVRFVPSRNVAEAAWRAARTRGVDVVHLHMTAAEWAAVPVRRFTCAAYVSTRHFAARRGRSGVVRRLSRLVPRVLDQQVAISSFVAAALGEPAVVVLNGVPVRDSTAAGERERVVLVLQRLAPEKDTRLALDAWARSRAPADGWRLLIAGKGPLTADLRAHSTSLGIDASVDFLGLRRDADVLLDRAGILLATAPAEPFGLSVVEAMAAGVPVVAAAGGAHLETVGSCTADYLFPPGDAGACAARLDALVADAGSRAAYGIALQRHQREHFDLEDHVDRLVEVYQAAIATRRRAVK